MDNDQLSDRWDSIAVTLAAILKKYKSLPRREHDVDFREWLENAICHAEQRAEALIDPS